jgi:hypothetical protein
MNEPRFDNSPDLRRIFELARDAIEMEKAGQIRRMTSVELETFQRNYPGAIMMLGDFLVLKVKP